MDNQHLPTGMKRNMPVGPKTMLAKSTPPALATYLRFLKASSRAFCKDDSPAQGKHFFKASLCTLGFPAVSASTRQHHANIETTCYNATTATSSRTQRHPSKAISYNAAT